MLHGVVRRKFSLTEDQLTSCVISYLDLLPQAVFLGWLGRAAAARPGQTSAPTFKSTATLERHLWPRTLTHGEPDALVIVKDAGRAHAIIIEAKYGAAKSQWSSCLDTDDLNQRERYDQLTRYGKALREGDFPDLPRRAIGDAEHMIVYLTADGAPPRSELEESLRHAPDLPLYWLSWHALALELEHVELQNDTQRLAASALRQLLLALGFDVFSDFKPRVRPVDAEAVWHFERRLFVLEPSQVVNVNQVWKIKQDGDRP